MAGINILAVILIIAFILAYILLFYAMIQARTRGTLGWITTIVAALIGVLLIVFLIANIANIVPADWAQILILLGLVAVTGMYALSTRKQADASMKMAEEMREQRVMASRPVIIQQAIAGKYIVERDMSDAFEIYNAGNGPAIELEISLLNKERTPIQSERKTFLRAGEPSIKFYPKKSVEFKESVYYVVCEYQGILSRGSKQTWYQTWLPFEIIKSEKGSKVYVKAGKLEFKEVSEKERIDAFSSRSKPK